MTLLRLDYQDRMRPFPWAGVALLALGLAISALAGIYYQGLAGKAAYWEARGGQVKNAENGLSDGVTSSTALEIKHANEVLNKIDLPWDKLFQAVESSSGKDVALLAMEPDAEKRQMRISGEARNIEEVLDYIGRLSGQKVFSSVYLHSHQVRMQDPEKPVRFSLVAAWEETP